MIILSFAACLFWFALIVAEKPPTYVYHLIAFIISFGFLVYHKVK